MSFDKRSYFQRHPEANTRAYRRWRNAYVASHPSCELCLKDGIIKPSEELDHIVRLVEGSKMKDVDNVQALCKDCHFAKTEVENRKAVHPKVQEWDDHLHGRGAK